MSLQYPRGLWPYCFWKVLISGSIFVGPGCSTQEGFMAIWTDKVAQGLSLASLSGCCAGPRSGVLAGVLGTLLCRTPSLLPELALQVGGEAAMGTPPRLGRPCSPSALEHLSRGAGDSGQAQGHPEGSQPSGRQLRQSRALRETRRSRQY